MTKLTVTVGSQDPLTPGQMNAIADALTQIGCQVHYQADLAASPSEPGCLHLRDHVALTPTGDFEIGDALPEMERVHVKWVCPDCLRVAHDEVWRELR